MSQGGGGGGGGRGAEPAPAAGVKLFTREELKSRNSRTDAILIIHNSVYDVTKFLEEHPGGEEVLLERAGQDATEPFEDVGHSSDGRALMSKYKVGELVAADRVTSAAGERRDSGAAAEHDPGSKLSAWTVPLVLGVLATLLYRFLFL